MSHCRLRWCNLVTRVRTSPWLRPEDWTFYGAQGFDFAWEVWMKPNWWRVSARALDNAEKCHCIECSCIIWFLCCAKPINWCVLNVESVEHTVISALYVGYNLVFVYCCLEIWTVQSWPMVWMILGVTTNYLHCRGRCWMLKGVSLCPNIWHLVACSQNCHFFYQNHDFACFHV